MMNFTFFLVGE
jgi:hypothetical protein